MFVSGPYYGADGIDLWGFWSLDRSDPQPGNLYDQVFMMSDKGPVLGRDVIFVRYEDLGQDTVDATFDMMRLGGRLKSWHKAAFMELSRLLRCEVEYFQEQLYTSPPNEFRDALWRLERLIGTNYLAFAGMAEWNVITKRIADRLTWMRRELDRNDKRPLPEH